MRRVARNPGDSNFDFNEFIRTLFTSPYTETDSDDWFDAFYDPSTNRLSESMGDLNEEPAGKPKPHDAGGTLTGKVKKRGRQKVPRKTGTE